MAGPDQGQRIEVAVSPQQPPVQTAAGTVARSRRDRADHLPCRDRLAARHQRFHRLVGRPQRGLPGSGVGHGDHACARDRPHEGHHPALEHPDRCAGRGGQVHAPVPGRPGQRRRIEAPQHIRERVPDRQWQRQQCPRCLSCGRGRRGRSGVRRLRGHGDRHGQQEQQPQAQQQRAAVGTRGTGGEGAGVSRHGQDSPRPARHTGASSPHLWTAPGVWKTRSPTRVRRGIYRAVRSVSFSSRTLHSRPGMPGRLRTPRHR